MKFKKLILAVLLFIFPITAIAGELTTYNFIDTYPYALNDKEQVNVKVEKGINILKKNNLKFIDVKKIVFFNDVKDKDSFYIQITYDCEFQNRMKDRMENENPYPTEDDIEMSEDNKYDY